MTDVTSAAVGLSSLIADRTRDLTGRERVSEAIDAWLSDLAGSRAFPLIGRPGTGKSAMRTRGRRF
jgi:hypothetical protein